MLNAVDAFEGLNGILPCNFCLTSPWLLTNFEMRYEFWSNYRLTLLKIIGTD